MKLRGFVSPNVLLGLGALVLLALIVWGVKAYLDNVDERAFVRGQQDVQGKWNKANADAEQQKTRDRIAVDKALQVASVAALKADEKATQADQRWQEAVRESKRKGVPLAACGPAGSAEPARTDVAGRAADQPAAPGVVDRVGAGVGVPRFSPEFVRQYDTAWTGTDGEPVFEVAAGGEGTAGTGAAWPTAEEVRDTHAENARRCSTDRRNYAALIDKIKAAAVSVDSSTPTVRE